MCVKPFGKPLPAARRAEREMKARNNGLDCNPLYYTVITTNTVDALVTRKARTAELRRALLSSLGANHRNPALP